MQFIRTILWTALVVALVAFIAMNWKTVPVNFWPLSDGNYFHFEWPIGLVALLFFLIGMAPMWLLKRAQGWRLKRRIASLENSLRAASAVAPVTASEAAPSLAPPLAVSEVAPVTSPSEPEESKSPNVS